MKDQVTKFDLEAAFKALDEIEVPKVKGIRPNRSDLHESVKRVDRLGMLVEDYYNLGLKEEVDAAEEARKADIAQAKLAKIEKIVDLDASSPEDILPSYVGKTIIQCPQCLTLFYKDPADIVVSETNPEVVNENEVCQHCGNDTGYTLIGKVAAETEEAPVEEKAEVDDITIEEQPAEEENAEGENAEDLLPVSLDEIEETETTEEGTDENTEESSENEGAEEGEEDSEEGVSESLKLNESKKKPILATEWVIQYYDGTEENTVDFEKALKKAEEMTEIQNIWAANGDYPYWTEEEGLFDLDELSGEIRSEFSESLNLNESANTDVKIGDKIRIIHLEDDYTDGSYNGKEGVIEDIDDIGQLHGTWGGLAVIPGVDEFELVIEECGSNTGALKEDIDADFAKLENILDEEIPYNKATGTSTNILVKYKPNMQIVSQLKSWCDSNSCNLVYIDAKDPNLETTNKLIPAKSNAIWFIDDIDRLDPVKAEKFLSHIYTSDKLPSNVLATIVRFSKDSIDQMSQAIIKRFQHRLDLTANDKKEALKEDLDTNFTKLKDVLEDEIPFLKEEGRFTNILVKYKPGTGFYNQLKDWCDSNSCNLVYLDATDPNLMAANSAVRDSKGNITRRDTIDKLIGSKPNTIIFLDNFDRMDPIRSGFLLPVITAGRSLPSNNKALATIIAFTKGPVDPVIARKIYYNLTANPIKDLHEDLDTDLDDKLKAHNEYIDYLQQMIKQEEAALEKAENEEIKAAIQRRLDAFKDDLKTALPDAVKDAVDTDLPMPEEIEETETDEEAVEKDVKEEENVKESLNEAKEPKFTEDDVIRLFSSEEFKTPATKEERELNFAESLEEDINDVDSNYDYDELEVVDTFDDLDDIEDFDEEAFDESVSKYLSEVYSNVESFKTTSCTLNNGTLIVEGLAKQDSGEAKELHFNLKSCRNNLFEGICPEIAKDGKFTLKCDRTNSNKTLVVKEMAYKYNKNNKLVEGIVKAK